MNYTIDQIVEHRLGSEADNWQKYIALIRALPIEAEVDVEDAASVLLSLGRTKDQLLSDVAAIKLRAEYRQRYEKAPAAKERLTQVEIELKKFEAAFEEFRRKHQQDVMPLIEERIHLQAVVDDARSAERRLRKSVVDQSLAMRQAQSLDSRVRLGNELRKLLHDLTPSNFDSPAYALVKAKEALATCQDLVAKNENNGNEAKFLAAQAELEFAKRNLQEKTVVIERLTARKRELDQEASLLADEADSLRAEELVP